MYAAYRVLCICKTPRCTRHRVVCTAGYPDFVAVDDKGTQWLLESKGAETGEVAHKDAAAMHWCENAAALTKTKWKYLKVPQKVFETLQPTRLEHLEALRPTT
jgi:hypothetical protein